MGKNPIKFITHSAASISLGFETMHDADFFLRAQSRSASWRNLWTLRYLEVPACGAEVVAECSEAVNLSDL